MTPFDPNTFFTTPTPNDIYKVLTKAPPLSRKALVDSYLGRPVAWQVKFTGGTPIHDYAPDIIRLQCFVNVQSTHVSMNIFTTINLADFPELRTAQRGQHILLYGMLTEVTEFVFTLDFVNLVLKPHHFWDSSY